MKLYYSPGACSLAVHIALFEAQLPFEAIKVNLLTHQYEPDKQDFYQIAPRGQVPLLELDNGERYTQCANLLMIVSDLAPKAKLMPKKETTSYYRTLEWINFISADLQKTFSPWLWKDIFAQSTKEYCLNKLNEHFHLLDQHFSERNYLIEEYSIADIYLFNVLHWTYFLDIPLDHYSHLKNYIERIKNRPHVVSALLAENLLKLNPA